MKILMREDFAGVTDRAFTGSIDEHAFVLTLTDVSAPDETRFPGSARDPFALRFVCALPIPQGTYTLANADLGTHDIFIVPTAQDDAGTHYQAVFT